MTQVIETNKSPHPDPLPKGERGGENKALFPERGRGQGEGARMRRDAAVLSGQNRAIVTPTVTSTSGLWRVTPKPTPASSRTP